MFTQAHPREDLATTLRTKQACLVDEGIDAYLTLNTVKLQSGLTSRPDSRTLLLN